MAEEDKPLKPRGKPTTLKKYAELAPDGSVVIRASDLGRAIDTASRPVKPFVEAVNQP